MDSEGDSWISSQKSQVIVTCVCDLGKCRRADLETLLILLGERTGLQIMLVWHLLASLTLFRSVKFIWHLRRRFIL